MDLEDFGVEFDDDGRLVGFQAGKAAALLDWEHRKSAREFMRLWMRLYQKKWRKENAPKLREQRIARRQANLEARRLFERLKMLEYNRKRRPKVAKVCEFCGKKWTSEGTPGMPRARTAGDGTRGPLKGQRLRRYGKYCSRSCGDKARHQRDLAARGGRPRNKLTLEHVARLRERAAAGAKRTDLAREFNISRGQVCAIVSGRAWKITDGAMRSRAGKGDDT